MTRRSLTIALLAACSFFVFAASASAKTLCVDTPTPQLTGCDSTFSYDASGLDFAVDYASNTVGYEGEDTVKIAPGTLTMDATASAMTYAGTGALHIVGAGRGVTTLQLTHDFTLLNGITLDATAQPSSSISDLTIDILGQVGSRVGISIQGGSVTRTNFRVIADSESLHIGLANSGTALTTVTDSEFQMLGGDSMELSGILASGDLFLSGVTMRGIAVGLNNQNGIRTDNANADVVVDGSRFENLDPALRIQQGTVKVLDSLLLNPSGELDTAVQFNSYGATDAALITSGVTIVGARTGVNVTSATPSPDVDLNNTIIQTSGSGAADIACAGSSGNEPGVTMRDSILKVGTPPSECHFTEIDVIDRALSPPVFVGTDDYRPAPGSPQIDAGSVIWPTMMSDPSPLIDFAGAARLVDGDGDGAAQLDIGAHEFKPAVVSSGPGPSGGGSTTPVPFRITLGKPTGKFKLRKKSFPFRSGTAKSKPRIAVSSNRAATVTLILLKPKAGYARGTKCVAKKPKSGKAKRCDLPIKGKQSFKIPLGDSFLTFGTKWANKPLKRGKYVLSMKATGLKDAPKSILSVIR